MGISESIVIGVVAGIITSVVLLILKEIFIKIVIPKYHEIIYKGIDINGNWKDESKNIKIIIEQKAHQVQGMMKVGHNEFIIDGTVWEGYLRLNADSVNKKRLSFVNILVKVSGQGDVMSGSFNYRNLGNDTISSEQITIQRTT